MSEVVLKLKNPTDKIRHAEIKRLTPDEDDYELYAMRVFLNDKPKHWGIFKTIQGAKQSFTKTLFKGEWI